MPDLKPCPFCGREARTVYDDDGLWYISCVNCLASVGCIPEAPYNNGFVCKKDAEEAWNRRAGEEGEHETG